MGDWRHVADAGDHQSGALQRPDSGLPTGARPLNKHVDVPEALVDAPAGGLLGGALGGKRGALAGTFEPGGPGAGRGNNVPLGIGDAYQGVVERGVDIGPALGPLPGVPAFWLSV